MEQQGISSLDELAQNLLDRRPKLPKLPALRSLAAYLSKLERGDDGWFRKRKEVLNALCEILGATESELLKPPAGQPAIWPFPSFPQLRPLELGSEEPRLLLDDADDVEDLFGVLPAGFAGLRFGRKTYSMPLAPRPHWIVAQPGSGARLMARWLEARKRGRCIEVRRLADAVGTPELQGEPRRVFIIVGEPDKAGDAAAAQALSGSARITVVSPFRFPLNEQPDLPHKVTDDAREDPDPHAAHETGWTLFRWRLAADWRQRLLDWVAERLGEVDSLFDSKQLLSWLSEFDAQERLFPNPGDVMPLCALLHEYGPHWLRNQTPKELSERLLELLTQALPEADGKLWLVAHAAQALKSLLLRRLSDLGVPLRGGSPAEVWARYLPADLGLRRFSEAKATAVVNELLRQKGRQKQEAKARLIARMTSPDPGESIALLRKAGILRLDQSGGLTIYPRWTQEQLFIDAAVSALQQQAPAEWGRWSIEPQRREILDQALDTLVLSKFMERVAQAAQHFEPTSLGAVGAVESLFTSVGRRLQDGWRPVSSQLGPLQALWGCAESVRMERAERAERPEALRLPRTRIDGYWLQLGPFLAACWAWSFHLPSSIVPKDSLCADPAWVWPGWGKVTVQDLPHVPVSSLEPSSLWIESGQFGSQEDRIFPLVDEFLSHCKDTVLPDHLETSFPFVAQLVVHAAREGWQIDTLSRYRWDPWQIRLILKRAEGLAGEARRRLAAWFIGHYLDRQDTTLGRELLSLKRSSGALHRFLIENVDWQGVRKQLEAEPAERLLRGLGGLPEELRSWAIARAARMDLPPHRLIELCQDGPEGSLEPLLQLMIEIAANRSDYSFTLPRRAYQLSVADALRAARVAWQRDNAAAATSHWFTEAPPSIAVRAPLLDLIRDLPPAERPHWTRSFLLSTLHYAGERSDEVFSMIAP